MSVVSYQIVAVLLFAVGASGFLLRRNVLVLLMSLQSMLMGAALLFASFGLEPGREQGSTAILFIIVISMGQTAIGLSLAIATFRLKRRLDVDAEEEVSS